MSAVGREVFAGPDQAIHLPASKSVGPEVGAPEDDRLGRFFPGTLEDQPADREGGLISKGFRIQQAGGIAAIDSARKVHQTEVGKPYLELVDDRLEVRPERVGVGWVVAELARKRDGLLDPGDLNLGRCAAFLPQVFVENGPRIIMPIGNRQGGIGPC